MMLKTKCDFCIIFFSILYYRLSVEDFLTFGLLNKKERLFLLFFKFRLCYQEYVDLSRRQPENSYKLDTKGWCFFGIDDCEQARTVWGCHNPRGKKKRKNVRIHVSYIYLSKI